MLLTPEKSLCEKNQPIIVCSKAKTHNIRSTKFRKFQEKCGGR